MSRQPLRYLRLFAAACAIAGLGIASSVAQQGGHRPPQGYARPPFHVHGNATMGPTGLAPRQVRHFYGLDQLAGSGYQGAGQVIAIIDAYDNPNAESDLGMFSTTFGLPACTSKASGGTPACFRKVYSSGSKPRTDSGWALESSLDIQWAHAVAPQAQILLVEAASANFNDLLAAVDLAVNSYHVAIVSMSWGAREFSSEAGYDTHFMPGGVSFFASSGDSGTGVDYPAASPYVVGVGGTTITTNASGDYLAEAAWSGSGGGQSVYEVEPTYQSGYGIPSNSQGVRSVPDVAYGADPNKGFSVYDSTSYFGQKGWYVIGGTSAGSPQWAGLVAVINGERQKAGKPPLNGAGALLYALAGTYALRSTSTSYVTNFHDITSGTNGSCGTLCNASTGYDYVTGLGSAVANNLVQSLIAQ